MPFLSVLNYSEGNNDREANALSERWLAVRPRVIHALGEHFFPLSLVFLNSIADQSLSFSSQSGSVAQLKPTSSPRTTTISELSSNSSTILRSARPRKLSTTSRSSRRSSLSNSISGISSRVRYFLHSRHLVCFDDGSSDASFVRLPQTSSRLSLPKTRSTETSFSRSSIHRITLGSPGSMTSLRIGTIRLRSRC